MEFKGGRQMLKTTELFINDLEEHELTYEPVIGGSGSAGNTADPISKGMF